ncbi:DUF4363 family protein [Bengtsoniella intestinalis]|uniref:DUF4363 family protein n=1 Tax=Bengtsoniella intestinalis TaxID=3073143 RepID=UPI00391F3592
MKLWMPLGVLVAMTVLAVVNSQTIYRQTSALQLQIQAVDEAVQADNWALAEDSLAQSHGQWDAITPYLGLVSNHTTIDNIEGMYLRAMAFCQTQEPTEFRAEIADLHHALQVLQSWESPSLENLF